VTGLAARILGINPTLDAVQVRNILLAAVQHDSATGDTPDPRWGYGKVDLTLGAVGGSLPPSLRVDTEELPFGILSQPTGIVLKASGGQPPYTWSQAYGQLPPGLILADGRITGVPVSPGVFRFSVALRDASPITQEVQRDFVMEIQSEPLFDIRIASLPPATAGAAYEAELQIEGGRPPFAWELAGGLLPQGITFQGGTLRGTPANVGRFSFTARAIDSAGGEAFRSFTVHVRVEGGKAWYSLGELTPAVHEIVVDPNNSAHIVALTSGPGGELIVESFDQGRRWNVISHNQGFLGPGEHLRVAINPITSTIWLAGGGFPSLFWYDRDTQRWKSPKIHCDLSSWIWINDLAFDRAGNLYVLAYEISCKDSTRDKYLGLFNSTDDGQSWELLSQFPPGIGPVNYPFYQAYGSLAVFPDSRTMYARLGENLERSSDRIFGSIDGGHTWRDLQSSLQWAGKIIVSANNPLDAVTVPPRSFDGAYGFIGRTVDGGSTWTRYPLPGVKDVCVLDRSLTEPTLLMAGTDKGAFLSVDSGATWNRVADELFVDDLCERRITPRASVTIDPSNANNLFIGTPARGIWYSGDRGKTWSPRSYGLSHTFVSGVAINPTNPSELLAVAGGDGPIVSRSAGNRWIVPTRRFEDIFYSTGGGYHAKISPRDPSLFFVATSSIQGGIFRSENSGVSWQRVGSVDREFIGEFDVDPFDSNVLLAYYYDNSRPQIRRSTDRGSTWLRISDADVQGITVCPSFARDIEGRVYAVGPEGLYISNDKGATWRLYSRTSKGFSVAATIITAPSNSEYVYIISGTEIWSYDPVSRIWQTFTLTDNEVSNRPVYGENGFLRLAVDPNNPMVAYAGKGQPGVPGFKGGIFKTENAGRTWRRISSPLDNFSVGGLSTHPWISGIVLACTWEDGCYRSEDSGISWQHLDEYNTIADNINVVIQDPSNPQRLLAGTEGFGVQESTDGGLSFEARVEGLGNFNINAIAFDPQLPTVVYAASDQGLYRSTDSGLTWSATGLASGKITDLVLDTGARPRRIWLTSLGRGVGYSSNDGVGFRFSSQGLASLDVTGIDLEVDGERRRLWVTSRGGDGISYSDDLGLTWKSAAGAGLTSRNANDLLIENGRPRRIWITTDSGVFYTNNAGLSWAEMSSGLPPGVAVTSIMLDPQSGEAFVSLSAEEFGGIYRGGNLDGQWTPFSGGLEERRVQRITRGRPAADGKGGSVLYAATTGGGIYISPNLASVGQPPRITTKRFPKGHLRNPYSVRLVAKGGGTPYTWLITKGALPPGLALDQESGLVSGRPISTGSYPITVRVSDTALRSSQRDFTLEIKPD
jgi:photosystem II stability/assembly factor-like uncharacterized protein